MMEVLSDIMMQLPLTVENEEVSGLENQCTFKFIMSSPMWEKLHKNIQGEQQLWAPPRRQPGASPGKMLTLEGGKVAITWKSQVSH